MNCDSLEKMGHLVTLSLTLQVLRPLFQIAYSRLYLDYIVLCIILVILRLDIRMPNYPMTETHILKDNTVNLAYRMYFESPVVLK